MACVYILYSEKLKKFYVGSCNDLHQRLKEHQTKIYTNSFTSVVDDWKLYFEVQGLQEHQARKIELHIKSMKSKKYIENLKKYSEILDKLLLRYRNI